MPELPEVETTLRGIMPHALGRRVISMRISNRALRWPIPPSLPAGISGCAIQGLMRRGKYLLLGFEHGHLMVHLGMSGSLRVVPAEALVGKHDHADIVLDSGLALRFNDPRRFGSILWLEGEPAQHPLLRNLGPEPLGADFDVTYLHGVARQRSVPVKSLLMDSRVVVGVGNIYANEVLFMSGIHPLRQARRVSLKRYARLTAAVKSVLQSAIAQGGTTLRDFVGSDGKPGYFKQQLQVYGRGSQPCNKCGGALKETRLSQRSTVYCPKCQR